MTIPQPSLLKIQTLQPSLQALARNFIESSQQAGIPVQIVQGYRSLAEQAALPSTVTNAPAGMSYHNYGLAFDAVPIAYLALPEWNPSGPLWSQLGAIGEGLGLEWGGRWSQPDRPHFQIPEGSAPIRELKAYWDKFKTVMPVELTPSSGGIIIIGLIIVGFLIVQRMART